jgi:hypothetical protein
MLRYVINLITLHTGALKDLIVNFFHNLLDLIIKLTLSLNMFGSVVIKLTLSLNMFGSVVVVVFQIIFCIEIHANNVFLFFKNYF